MRFFKKTAPALFFIFAVSAFCPYPADAKKAKPPGTCKSVIFSNSTKGKRLFGKDVERKVLPASTVKIMTALLVLERLPLDRYVTVGAAAGDVQPTKLNLVPGEQYKVGDLLYAILLKSANDASVVLAEAVAGSEEEFVDLMNRRARQLGARNTKFANPHGLPTTSKDRAQYTTAYDMYLIFLKALKHSFFREAIKRKYKTIYSSDGREITLKSHNKILFSGWKKEIYGKTGYTRAAGTCFVGTLNDGGNTLVIGVFGCNDRWGYIKRIVSKYGGVEL